MSAPPRPSAADHAAQRGVQIAIGAYLIWGFLTIYWKQITAFDAFELIAWRIVCSGIVMAVIVTFRRSWPVIWAAMRHWPTARGLAIAGVLLTANWTAYVWAVANDRVIETALGYFIAPLATMAIGVFVFDEEPSTAQRVAFGLAAVAVVVLTISYGRPPWIALIIAASWSLYGAAKRTVALGAVDSLAGETFIVFLPALALIAAMTSDPASIIQSADTVDWIFVLGTGIVTAVPLMMFASAAKSVPFTLLGPLNLLVPVINFGLGWLVYDEPMPTQRLIGFGFVWIALLVVMWERVATYRRGTMIAAAP